MENITEKKDVALTVILPIHNPNFKAYFQKAFVALCAQQTNFNYDVYIVDDCSQAFKQTPQYKQIYDFIDNYDTHGIEINWINAIESKKFDCDKENDKNYLTRTCLGPANCYQLAFTLLNENEVYNETPKFFVGLSQDNIIKPNKLQVLYDKIKDSKYDVVFNSWESQKNEQHVYDDEDISFDVLLNNPDLCKITNAICRVSSYKTLPFLWTPYWKSDYDYEQFVFAKFRRNFKMCIIPEILNYNKSHKDQYSKHDVTRPYYIDMIKHIYNCENEGSDAELTCIIMFRNEGCEIEKTIQSIRATTNNIPIVLVDDDSVDNYNYEELKDIYTNVRYYRNKENYGTAYSRDLGVEKTETPYFVQLDGHMRFYNNNWVDYVMPLLRTFPDCILFSRSITIRKNNLGVYDNEEGTFYHQNSCGAFINTADAYEFTSKWSYKMNKEMKDKTLIEVPCCLGACYFSSKAHWTKIKGLWGLKQWGQEEPMMSIKTWLLGGKVLLMNKFWSGHVYRDLRPYSMDTDKTTYNHLLLNHLFTDKQEMADAFDVNIQRRFPKHIKAACKIFTDNIKDIQAMKTYLVNNSVHDMNWFFQFNEKFMQEQDFVKDSDGRKQKVLR